MKHAFLIIAHTDYKLLQVLIGMLDNECCDIYVLIDKKSPLPSVLRATKARLFILKKRIDIRWGHVSQIKAEMLLFEAALNNGPYVYYHLLSGVDLPIKPIDKILSFFEQNRGVEFVGFSKKDDWLQKVMKWQFFIRYYNMKGRLGIYITYLRYKIELVADKYIKRSYMPFKKGSNWVSITDDFCRYLIGKKSWIFKRFRYTFCGDEIFLQTVLWNSPYKANIYSLDDEFKGCQREIIWEDDNPHVWGSSPDDVDILRKSDKLFARKFSSKYPEIIDEVQKIVKQA